MCRSKRDKTRPVWHHTPGVEATRKAGPHLRLIAVRFSFAAHVCLLDTLVQANHDVPSHRLRARAMDVVVWLRSLGLGKYEAAFRENDIGETA